MDYVEKLKDPRWQRKRLKILERDRWECRVCGSTDKTLHVHHIFYINDVEPWAIHDGFLITVCEECHLSDNELGFPQANLITTEIGDLLSSIWKAGFTREDLSSLSEAIERTERIKSALIYMTLNMRPWTIKDAPDRSEKLAKKE